MILLGENGLSRGAFVGRPSGGIGILHRNSLAGNMKLNDSSDRHYIYMELNTASATILFINLYMRETTNFMFIFYIKLILLLLKANVQI